MFKSILKYIVWEIINSLVLKSKRKKIYQFDNNLHGLNIGCGLDNINTWLGIDGGIYLFYAFFPKTIIKIVYNMTNNSQNYTFDELYEKIKVSKIIHFDVNYGLPFKDESIPNIFTSHFLEHLSYADSINLLTEAYRVLKPSGRIRICVPSLEEEVSKIEFAVGSYKKGDDEKIMPYVTSGNYGFVNEYSCHRYMYNYSSLQKLLKACGYRVIELTQIGIGKLIDIQYLDTREGLYIEAIK